MTAAPAIVLLVEDEVSIRRFLRPAIDAAGWSLIEAETGQKSLLEASQSRPDVIILDLGLPDMDGIEVVGRVREWSTVPIIVLSARGQEKDKIAALDAGADDYVQKPFSIGELVARIRVALRHAAGRAQPSATLVAGDIVLDLVRRTVTRSGQGVHLTPIEYKLLTTLAGHAGLVMTHRQLLREVWGPGHAEDSTYLRMFVRQLRQKLEHDPAQPKHLLTEVGVGYRFVTWCS
ncbi:KDP operon transcriptional regulatory protein KdpE [Phycisphaerae bacterium RAS1]|nr:KDP operon transcriptional regulatory protein KdpE [Phycisphaerae bacterium RAS1]